MVFRDAAQITDVCRALCALAGQHNLWTHSGPTDRAVEWIDANPLSTSQRVLFGIAWGIWGGCGHVHFPDLVHHVDGPALKAVGALLMALAEDDEHLDAWLAAYGAPSVRPIRGPQ